MRNYPIPENKSFEVEVGRAVFRHFKFDKWRESQPYDHFDIEFMKDNEMYRLEIKDRNPKLIDLINRDGAIISLKKWLLFMEDIKSGIGSYLAYTFGEDLDNIYVYKFLDTGSYELRPFTGRTVDTRCDLDIQHYIYLPWDKFIKIGATNA